MCAPYVEARPKGGARAEKEIGEKAQKIIPFSSPFQKTKKKKIILFFPELFSGRDDGHRERRHEEERVFTRRARIEEFPQCGRGFSVRTFVASFVLRVRLIIRIRALRVVLLCGVASMTRRDRNFKTSSSSSSETFGDARIPKRREFWTWHSRRGREKKIIASC